MLEFLQPAVKGHPANNPVPGSQGLVTAMDSTPINDFYLPSCFFGERVCKNGIAGN